ncbi:MAG: sigma-70 family RNA polymerase sigma factor [Ferruginibacter sp.]
MAADRKFSDEELLYSLRTGKERDTAIRFMYDHFFGSLSRYVINNQGNMEDAEDVFQDVVLNFISLVHENKFRGESSIKTFLFSLNRFGWLNELKRKGRANVREVNFEKAKDMQEKDVSNLMMERESTNQVLKLVETLGESCRKILLMFYYENLPMKDILTQLDYENEQVVRNKKYKCLKQLEKMIADNPQIKNILKTALNG